jgi:hypothetical protein
VVQAIASVVTAIGIVIAVVGLRQTQRQRLRQFEALYVKRYWELMDRLSLAALKEDRTSSVVDEDQRAIRAYLRLCEDQLELRREGWISSATWLVWAEGIMNQLMRCPFDEVWAEVEKETQERERDEFVLLRRFISEKGADPCAVRGWRAFLRGLTGSPG